MAERKYELWTVKTKVPIIKIIPWYKKPIEKKYLRFDKKFELKSRLNIDNWKLSYVINQNSSSILGCGPVLLNGSVRSNASPSTTQQGLLGPLHIKSIYTHNKERITFILKQLMQYPMLIFPYFEKNLPDEDFDRAFELLNQGIEQSDEGSSHSIYINKKNSSRPSEDFAIPSPNSKSILDLSISDKKSISSSSSSDEESCNIDKNKEIRAKLIEWIKFHTQKQKVQKEKFSISNDPHVKRQTKLFCDWIDKCGGHPENRIDDNIIINLFASSFESKPSLSAPIKVVDKQSVPLELLTQTDSHSLRNSSAKSSDRNNSNIDSSRSSATNLANNVNKKRFNYGAWYLPINEWNNKNTKSVNVEKKLINRHQMKENSDKLDTQLSGLYATTAFCKFAKENEKPLPKVLARVKISRAD